MHMHLLSTINRSYVVPFQVTLDSLLRRIDSNVTLDWHVFGDGLNEADRAVIEATAGAGAARIRWYAPATLAADRFPTRGHFVPHVYARILAPDLLPGDIGRFMYVDADMLVFDDVSGPWKTVLEGAIVAAVQDMAVPQVSSPMGLRRFRELGFAADAPYFNAGFYVVDAARWRDLDVTRDALEYIARYRESINLLDQDAMNAVLGGNWRRLPLRWNLVAGLAGRGHYRPRGIDRSEYERAVAKPGIVHFSGLLKPWRQPRLASPGANDNSRALGRVAPAHETDGSLRARSLSFYDRHLRRALYPFERYVWRLRRGF